MTAALNSLRDKLQALMQARDVAASFSNWKSVAYLDNEIKATRTNIDGQSDADKLARWLTTDFGARGQL